MLMYLPLYNNGAKIDTIQERREALKGFIFSPFRMNDLMNKIALEKSTLNFEIYDSENMAEKHLLYRSFQSSSYISKFKTIKTLQINNRTWNINLFSTPAFDAATDSKYPLLITFIGLVINLFLIIVILTLIKSRQKIKAQAKKNEEQASYMLYQSRLAQMGEMISIIAHQWRQPLASISAITGNLTISIVMEKYNSVFFQEQLDSIGELTQYLSSTINDFREFFKENKEQQSFNIKELIDGTLKIFGSSLKSNNIELDFEYKDEIIICTFFNEVTQVILNILKNAEDALVEHNNSDAKIWISWYVKEGFAYMSIEDNAGGIPKEIIGTIFNPYFSTKQTKDGTGLGLYMSKKIIEDHCKGHLSVVNTARGAKFTIALPTTAEKIK